MFTSVGWVGGGEVPLQWEDERKDNGIVKSDEEGKKEHRNRIERKDPYLCSLRRSK